MKDLQKQKKYTKRYMKRIQLSYSILKKVVKECVIEEEILTLDNLLKTLTKEEQKFFNLLVKEAELKRQEEDMNNESLGEKEKN